MAVSGADADSPSGAGGCHCRAEGVDGPLALASLCGLGVAALLVVARPPFPVLLLFTRPALADLGDGLVLGRHGRPLCTSTGVAVLPVEGPPTPVVLGAENGEARPVERRGEPVQRLRDHGRRLGERRAGAE